MKHLIKATTVAVFVFTPIQVMAESTVIPFTGVVENTCIITAQADGILATDGTLKNLGTRHGFGRPGTATVLTSGDGLEVIVSAVSSFTQFPGAYTGGEIWDTTYNLSGTSGNIATNVAGNTSTALDRSGVTDVEINVNARRPGTAIFDAGSYETQVTLTCE